VTILRALAPTVLAATLFPAALFVLDTCGLVVGPALLAGAGAALAIHIARKPNKIHQRPTAGRTNRSPSP